MPVYYGSNDGVDVCVSRAILRKQDQEQEQMHEKRENPYYFFKPSFGTTGRIVQKRVTVVTFEHVDNAGIVEL